MKRFGLTILSALFVLCCTVTPALALPQAEDAASQSGGWLVTVLLVLGAALLALLAVLAWLQHRLVRRLKLLAERDELTGLMNKRTFCAETKKRLNAGRQYVLVRFDVDHFKMINDAMGVAAGDRLLQTIGSVLLEATKARWEVITVGRLDADHFSFCAEMNRQDTEHFCRQVEKAIHACAVGYDITLRFGLCAVSDPFMEVSAYCDHALMALRSIKDIYHGSLAWYDDNMRQEEQRIQELEAVMETALAAGEFVPYFQAQYNYETGAIIGAEALVRWISPEKGMIAPDRFIPQFEKNGFIYRMDLAVWEQVCAQMRAWLDAGIAVPRLSVNVSRCDITHSELPQQIKALVDKYGLTPDMLHLESTETGFAERPEQMLEVTNQLRAMGFCIEIDDFGSGYSSLNTLRQLPADMLKLDLRFLDDRGGTGSSRGGLILSAVVRMAHSIDLPVIAEGVETKEQADFLKSIGCVYMQGYYFARPVCAGEFTALLRTQREAHIAPRTSGGISDAADFLDASTQSTLLFNSFVGGAGIFEYGEGRLEALRLNDQFFATTHIPREGHRGYCIDILETLTDDTRGQFVRMLDEATAGSEQSKCYCCSNRTSTAGKNEWFFNRARCLQRKGDAYIIYIAMENITAWMRELRHNESLRKEMELLLAHFPGGFARFHCEGGALRRELIGGGLPERLGYTAEEMMRLTAQDPMALVHPDCRRRVEQERDALLKSQRPVHAQYRLLAKDGAAVWFDVCGAMVGTPDDGCIFLYYADLLAQQALSRRLRDELGQVQENGPAVTFHDALALLAEGGDGKED